MSTKYLDGNEINLLIAYRDPQTFAENLTLEKQIILLRWLETGDLFLFAQLFSESLEHDLVDGLLIAAA